jgi:hypothetical protein
MMDPKFDPESAVILHRSIFSGGLADRLLSNKGAIADYENLYSALCAINAPVSGKVVAEFLDLFRRVANEGFGRIEQEVRANCDHLEDLGDRYMNADEDVPGMIHRLYEELEGD